MDPVSAGIAAGGQLLGGILGQIDWNGDRASQRRLIEDMIRRAGSVRLPELERLQAELLGPSAAEGVYSDPELAAAQYDALGGLGDIVDSGGMTLEDRAVQEEALRAAAQRAQAQRRSVLAMLDRSGQGATSGAAVAAQLSSAREQADRAADIGLRTAGSAQRRALEAMMERGRMASSMRSQDFSERSRRADAKDAISRYNAGALANARAYNVQLPQQQFQNQMSRTTAQMAPSQLGAQYYGQNADRLAGTISNFGSGLGYAGAGAYEALRKPATADGFRSDTLDDRYLR